MEAVEAIALDVRRHLMAPKDRVEPEPESHEKQKFFRKNFLFHKRMNDMNTFLDVLDVFISFLQKNLLLNAKLLTLLFSQKVWVEHIFA